MRLVLSFLATTVVVISLLPVLLLRIMAGTVLEVLQISLAIFLFLVCGLVGTSVSYGKRSRIFSNVWHCEYF